MATTPPAAPASAAAGTGRRSPITRAEGERRMIAAATALLSEGPFSSVGVRAIAARADVNQGFVHTWFGSRNGLYLRVVMECFSAMLARMQAQPAEAIALDPLNLQAQSLSFWRWPEAPQSGAAIYLVMDRPAASGASLLLYVGETSAAERRWKGEHDCKRYLDAYAEALQRADLPLTLSIRFWLEVPQQTRPRRDLEQALIRRWLPPFNKETRGRWATPFTAPPD